MTDEPTVKTLLEDKGALESVVDEATRAQLERWFGLPSFTQLEEEKKAAPPTDVEMAEAIARRDKALACVDPATLAAIERRNEIRAAVIEEDREVLTVSAQRPTALADLDMMDHGYHFGGEPSDFVLPPGIEEDLQDCAPQALLRNLHRPETNFYKEWESVDYLAEARVDPRHEAHVATTTRHQVTTGGPSTFAEGRALLLELRAEHRLPWTRVLGTNLANRRVVE